MNTAISPTVSFAVQETMQLIARGGFGGGARLPGERSLADTIGVSRTTVRHALRKLEEDGVIFGHPQRGWYVRDGKGLSDRSTELESFTEVALARGFTPSSDVLAFETRKATIDEAESLRIPPASGVIEIERVRKVDDIPICIDRSIVVESLCSELMGADLTTGSLYAELRDRCGVAIYRSSCVLQARSPSPQESELLALAPHDPVLEILTTSSSVDGTPVLTSRVVYRGDSYRFQAELYRNSPFI